MTADLVTRLRGWLDEDTPIGVIMNEAAARIEALEAENASLSTWQCEFTDGRTGPVYGEGGSTYCAMAKRVEALEKDLSETDTEFATLSNDLGKALSRVEALEAALQRIADTDPDEGTQWFHDVANAALEDKA